MNNQFVHVLYDKDSMNSSQYANILHGIRTAASRYAVPVTLISNEQFESLDPNALPIVSIATGADMPFLNRVIRRLQQCDRLVVLAGCDSEQFGHDVSCATPSRRTETQQLINYLFNCGKTKLALVGFDVNSYNDTFRYHAAMTAAASWGDILKEEDVYHWEKDPGESFERFLQNREKYDAVVCPNDIIAVCLINRCRENNIRVPEDLFVASFGNMSVGKYHTPSITSMTMDMEFVGEQAFFAWRFLITNERSQRSALKITVPSKLIIRESTACMHAEALHSLPHAIPLDSDRFYQNPTIAELVRIERCISSCDAVNLRMLKKIMDGESYEQTADELFISGSTLRYRLNKIFDAVGVHSRHELERTLHDCLGGGNPFSDIE